jgi:hypothetical protein
MDCEIRGKIKGNSEEILSVALLSLACLYLFINIELAYTRQARQLDKLVSQTIRKTDTRQTTQKK